MVSSPDAFADAVASYRFVPFALDDDAVARARQTLAETGMLLVGEPHGVLETPSVLYELARVLGTRALAFEWSHDELDGLVQRFLGTGTFDFDRFWALPPSAEFFAGDGRITAGHFALLHRLWDERRLEDVILFDRLDPEPPPDDWRPRDREMAERILRERDGRVPLLILTGAFHATPRAPEGDTMAAHLVRHAPGLRPAMLAYSGGHCWSRGTLYELGAPMPAAPIVVRVGPGSPAVVPGRFEV